MHVAPTPIVGRAAIPVPYGRSALAAKTPDLDQALGALQPLPGLTLLLGLRENGRPLLFDLDSPLPGSLLIAGDAGDSNQAHLRSILLSACKLNGAREVNLHLICSQPAAYYDVVAARHCLQYHRPDEFSSEILVEELCNLVEMRANGTAEGPVQILAIDRLEELVGSFENKFLEDLLWLLEEGPRQRVYVFAVYSTTQFLEAHIPFIEAFDTRVLGRIHVQELAIYLSELQTVAEVTSTREAYVRSGRDFVKILVPQVGREA